MSRVRESIDVAVPVHVAYERLCHFEEYPHFMGGVQEVTQVSADISHWIMDLDGTPAEFDAQIIGQRTDELLAWQAIEGPLLAETMTFHPLGEDRTRIVAELELEARALMPSEAYGHESLDRRLKADLDGFKRYIETDISGVADHNVAPANPAPGDGGTFGTARGNDFATRGGNDFAVLGDGGFSAHGNSRGAAQPRPNGAPAGRLPAGGARHGRNSPGGRSGRR